MIKAIRTIFVFVLSLLAVSVTNASVYNFSYQGIFSALDSSSKIFDSNVGRVNVSGAISYDDIADEGTFSVSPFVILSSGVQMESSPATMIAVSDGGGDAGNLIQSDINFTTDGGSEYLVSLEWDATGFFNALAAGLPVPGFLGQFAELHGDVLTKAEFILPDPFPSPFSPPSGLNTTTVNIGSVAPVSDLSANLNGLSPVGLAPFASTTPFGNASPIASGPFPGFYLNLDIRDMTLESIGTSPVPLPAAFWLFLSGFGALFGLTRMKR